MYLISVIIGIVFGMFLQFKFPSLFAKLYSAVMLLVGKIKGMIKKDRSESINSKLDMLINRTEKIKNVKSVNENSEIKYYVIRFKIGNDPQYCFLSEYPKNRFFPISKTNKACLSPKISEKDAKTFSTMEDAMRFLKRLDKHGVLYCEDWVDYECVESFNREWPTPITEEEGKILEAEYLKKMYGGK